MDRPESALGLLAGIKTFISGVDLRTFKGPVVLTAQDQQRRLWSRLGAQRSGNGLSHGLAVGIRWSAGGNISTYRGSCLVTISRNAGPGILRLQWWDCERGIILKETTWNHPGGQLRVQAPAFVRHIAWKLMRIDQ